MFVPARLPNLGAHRPRGKGRGSLGPEPPAGQNKSGLCAMPGSGFIPGRSDPRYSIPEFLSFYRSIDPSLTSLSHQFTPPSPPSYSFPTISSCLHLGFHLLPYEHQPALSFSHSQLYHFLLQSLLKVIHPYLSFSLLPCYSLHLIKHILYIIMKAYL